MAFTSAKRYVFQSSIWKDFTKVCVCLLHGHGMPCCVPCCSCFALKISDVINARRGDSIITPLCTARLANDQFHALLELCMPFLTLTVPRTTGKSTGTDATRKRKWWAKRSLPWRLPMLRNWQKKSTPFSRPKLLKNAFVWTPWSKQREAMWWI